MNIKNATLYRYIKYLKLSVAFYALLTVIVALIAFVRHLYPHEMNGLAEVNTIYFLTAIFTFVLGLLSFKEEQNMFVQNGLTRQKSHFSFILSLPICVLFALLERLYTYCMSSIFKASYMHFMGNKFMIQNGSFIMDVVLETLGLACILALGYLVAVWSIRVKIIYRILTVIVIAFGIIAEFTFAEAASLSRVPEFVYVYQVLLYGSAGGELVINYYIVSHILLISAILSAAHIMALGINVNGKEKRS